MKNNVQAAKMGSILIKVDQKYLQSGVQCLLILAAVGKTVETICIKMFSPSCNLSDGNHES